MTSDEDITIRTIITRLTSLAPNDETIQNKTRAAGKKSKATKFTKSSSVNDTIEPRTFSTPLVTRNRSSLSDQSPTPRRLVNAVIKELKGAPDTEKQHRKENEKVKSTSKVSTARMKINKKGEHLPPLNIEIDDSDDSNDDLTSNTSRAYVTSAKRRRKPIPVKDLVNQVQVLKQRDDLETPVHRTKKRLDSSTASTRPKRKIRVQDLADTISSMKKSEGTRIDSSVKESSRASLDQTKPNKNSANKSNNSFLSPTKSPNKSSKSPTRTSTSFPPTTKNPAKKFETLTETLDNLSEAVSKTLFETRASPRNKAFKTTKGISEENGEVSENPENFHMVTRASKKKAKTSEITPKKAFAVSEEIIAEHETILNSETASGSSKTIKISRNSSETLNETLGSPRLPTPSKRATRNDKNVVVMSGKGYETPQNLMKTSGVPSSRTPSMSTRSSCSKVPVIASEKIARTPLQSNKMVEKSKGPSTAEKVVEISKSSKKNVGQGNRPIDTNEESKEDSTADSDSENEISPTTSRRKGERKMEGPVLSDVTPRTLIRKSPRNLSGYNPVLGITTLSPANRAAVTGSARKSSLKTLQELQSSTKHQVSFGKTTLMPNRPSRKSSNTNNSGSPLTDAGSDVESTKQFQFFRNSSKVPGVDNSGIGKIGLDKESATRQQPKSPLKITPQKNQQKRMPTRNSSVATEIFFDPPSPDFNEEEELSDAINTAIEISSQSPNKRDSPDKMHEKSAQNNEGESNRRNKSSEGKINFDELVNTRVNDANEVQSDDEDDLESEAATELDVEYEDLSEQEDSAGELDDDPEQSFSNEADAESNNRNKRSDTKSDVGVHPLRKFAVNRFRFHSGVHLDKEGMNIMLDGVATFFDDMIPHLKYFAEHAHRKRISEKDTKLFMWRQGFITEKRSFDYLVLKYMSHEHQRKMLPFPKIPHPKQLHKK